MATSTTIVIFSTGSVMHILNAGEGIIRWNWSVLWQEYAATREALPPANRVKAVKTEPNINARKFDFMQKWVLGWVYWEYIRDAHCTI